jgi:hypothetical protein
MRFVPVKSIDQQARLMVHRARQGYPSSTVPRPFRQLRLIGALADQRLAAFQWLPLLKACSGTYAA